MIGLSKHLARVLQLQGVGVRSPPEETWRGDVTCNNCREHYISGTVKNLNKRLNEHQLCVNSRPKLVTASTENVVSSARSRRRPEKHQGGHLHLRLHPMYLTTPETRSVAVFDDLGKRLNNHLCYT